MDRASGKARVPSMRSVRRLSRATFEGSRRSAWKSIWMMSEPPKRRSKNASASPTSSWALNMVCGVMRKRAPQATKPVAARTTSASPRPARVGKCRRATTRSLGRGEKKEASGAKQKSPKAETAKRPAAIVAPKRARYSMVARVSARQASASAARAASTGAGSGFASARRPVSRASSPRA